MKDAKGHGSDAHSTGVQQVGRVPMSAKPGTKWLSDDKQTVWEANAKGQVYGTPNWDHPAVKARFDPNSDESREARYEKALSSTRP